MSIDSCFEREIKIIDQQLADGEIDIREYNKQVRELERDLSLDMSDYGEWHQ